ncbi:MAG: CoA-binding protein [Ignisphaera sp.]|nr:CoA-binding protein [Ignisphaera sp.]MDW8085982.1 CoA-binding protein [Ignisphaera sp.]
MSHSILSKFFQPSSVAIVGASPKEGKIGRVILENFISRFGGRVYPVNRNYDEILGLKCYRSVGEIPEAPDLAVVAVPAPEVPAVVEELGERGTRAVIVVSGGFREMGTAEGELLERKLLEVAKSYGVRLLGPNCIGVFDNWNGVNTFFTTKMKIPPRGCVGIISQSGAFAIALMDLMAHRGIGVSRAVSYGNKIDVDDVELLEFFGKDDRTRVVLMYIEGLREGRGRLFIDVARRVSEKKPIVIYKAGRTARGGRAAASHTAAVAGDYQIYRAAFRQAGVVEAESFDEMLDVVRIFLDQPLICGNRVFVVTDAGGVGVMLTDALTSVGFELPVAPPSLRERLRNELPPHAIVDNPVDLTGDASDERYVRVLEIIAEDGDADAIVVAALPQIPNLRGTFADYVAELKNRWGKPIVSLVIGSKDAIEIAGRLQEKGVTVFESPERLAKSLRALYLYSMFRAGKRCC